MGWLFLIAVKMLIVLGNSTQHLKDQRILMCCELSQISFDTTSEGMFPMSITKPCSYLGIKSSGKSELTAFLYIVPYS